MAIIEVVEREENQGGGGMKPPGNYNFCINSATLEVETGSGWVDVDTFEGNIPDEYEDARRRISLDLSCDGPSRMDHCFDKIWLTPKGKFKWPQVLESVGLDPEEKHDTEKLIGRTGVAALSPGYKNFLEPKKYYPKDDAPKVQQAAVSSVAEDDVPF